MEIKLSIAHVGEGGTGTGVVIVVKDKISTINLLTLAEFPCVWDLDVSPCLPKRVTMYVQLDLSLVTGQRLFCVLVSIL